MNQTSHDRLTALAETYKQQKFRLPKPQIEEAASLLTQAFADDAGGDSNLFIGFVRDLPPDSTAKAIRDSWLGLAEETKGHLQMGILDLPRTDRFDRLKLIAAAAVADVDPQRGTVFLCCACTSLDSKSNGHMSSEVLQIFRKTFLDEVDCRLEKLDIAAHPSAVTGALLASTIQSLFTGATESPSTPPVFQLRLVKWIFRNKAYRCLRATQQTRLIETIKRWTPELQYEFRTSLESLPSGFEFLLSPMPQEDVVPRPDSPESLSSRSEAVPAPSLKTRPHWKDLLTELQKQINGLDQDLAAKKEQWAKGQEENEKLKKSVENLENHIQNLQTELGKRAEELEKTIEALTAARTAVAQVTRRAEVMDAKIAELKQKHQEEIGILNSRIETEATHRLEGFKHSVARVLRVDYADFKINAGKPMTVELGQGLHHLLASIFDGLQKSGINAKD